MTGWMDDGMDGWMDGSREKASRKITTTSFTVCNRNKDYKYNKISKKNFVGVVAPNFFSHLNKISKNKVG
jgi:hypothetical protein